jgi:hypothetical protein
MDARAPVEQLWWLEEDEPGAEPPPALALDERRMHVRAYHCWTGLLRGRAYPSAADLQAMPVELAPHSVLLDFSAGPADPRLVSIGERLRSECADGPPPRSVADVPSRSLLSRLTDHYLQIIANRAPIGFEAEFVSRRGFNTLYRGILMPLSSDDVAIDHIFGVINWKELADDDTVADLAAQVDRALTEAAGPAGTPTPWALAGEDAAMRRRPRA